MAETGPFYLFFKAKLKLHGGGGKARLQIIMLSILLLPRRNALTSFSTTLTLLVPAASRSRKDDI